MFRITITFAWLMVMSVVIAHAGTTHYMNSTEAPLVIPHDSRQEPVDPHLLQQLRERLGEPSIDLRIWRRHELDDRVVLRLQQFFEGMLVWNSVVIVHTDANDRIFYLDGGAVADFSGTGLTSKAGMPRAQAEQLVRDFYTSAYPNRIVRSVQSDYYQNPIVYNDEGKDLPKVSHFMIINDHYVVIMDANTGEILAHWDSSRH